jgi:hypothetical protein
LLLLIALKIFHHMLCVQSQHLYRERPKPNDGATGFGLSLLNWAHS